jgi:arylsulfatase A-like enzyme
MQDYLACVQGVDDSVGEVLDYLDRAGLAQNTVVMYSADNGWYLGDLGMYDKRFMYEPGLHIPLLARGPGVKPGSSTKLFATNADFAPTFLELAGLPVPADMHGRSLVPLFRGESPRTWPTSVYYRYYHDPGHHNTRAHYGVRTTTHKLIHYWKKDMWELFDLTRDPTEQRNLIGDPAQAGRIAELKAEIVRLQKQLGDTGQFANAIPRDGVDAPKNVPVLGTKSVAQAIAASVP